MIYSSVLPARQPARFRTAARPPFLLSSEIPPPYFAQQGLATPHFLRLSALQLPLSPEWLAGSTTLLMSFLHPQSLSRLTEVFCSKPFFGRAAARHQSFGFGMSQSRFAQFVPVEFYLNKPLRSDSARRSRLFPPTHLPSINRAKTPAKAPSSSIFPPSSAKVPDYRAHPPKPSFRCIPSFRPPKNASQPTLIGAAHLAYPA